MVPLKVLVVEDDVPSLELMTEVFVSLQAEVRSVSDSRKASTIIQEEKFDGIFLDLEMPNVHGFDLARQVRQSRWNQATPIMIVTGREDRRTMQEAFELGATFFLQKPVDRQKLTSLFRTVRGTLEENRRRHLRIPLQAEVTCTVGSKTIKGTTWNVSQGGLQVEMHDLEAGSTVRLSFRLPYGDKVEAVGSVAWVNENRQGIRFTKISAASQEAILGFIAEMQQK